MPGIHFDITCDNKDLLRALQEAKVSIDGTVGELEKGAGQMNAAMDKAGSGIEATFKRIGAAAAGVFAAARMKEFIGQVVDVRKEYQSLELSFNTLLGSAEKGKKLFSEITQFAVSTPMDEKTLAKGAQTLLSFNIAAEKVMPTLRQIGDISMGDAQKFESLTLAFAQASSTGKLMGQDRLQMVNAGFNPITEMARTTGRSIEDLNDAMGKGEISVKMLEDAFASATAEGGKFHGMLDTMSGGMQGAFSNLQGALQKLYNDLGQSIEQPLVEGANAATEAVNGVAENIKVVAAVIEGAAVTFGTYKAAAMVAATADAAHTAVLSKKTLAMLTTEKASKALAAAQDLLNKTMLKNPWVLAATAIAAAGMALYAYSQRADAATLAQKSLNEELEAAVKAQEESAAAAERAVALATDETKANKERQKGIQELVAKYGDVIQKYIDEEGHLTNIIALKRELAEIDGRKTSEKMDDDADKYEKYARIAETMRKRQLNTSAHGGMPTDEERKAYEEAMDAYTSETGRWRISSSAKDLAQYFSAKAKGKRKQAGQRRVQTNVDAFAGGIGQMSDKDLKKFERRLRAAQTLVEGRKNAVVNVPGISKAMTAEQISGLLTQIGGVTQARQKKSGEDGGKTGDKNTATAPKKKKKKKKSPEDPYAEYDGEAYKAAEREKKIRTDIAALEKQAAEQSEKGETAAAAQTERRLKYARALLQVSETRSKVEWLKGSSRADERHAGNLAELANQRAQLNPGDTYALAANDRAVTEENERYADEVAKLNLGFTEAWQNFQSLSSAALERLKEQLQTAVTEGVDGRKISEELRAELQARLDEVEAQQASMRAYEGGGAFGQSGVFGRNGVLGGTPWGRFGQTRQDAQSARDTHAYYKSKADTARAETEEARAEYGENHPQYQKAKAKQAKAEEDERQSGDMMSSVMSGAATGGAGMMVNAINANAQSMAEAGNMLFGEGSDAANTIGKFAESSQHATDAFNSLSQGDFIGAAMSLGEAVSDLGEMFGFWSNSNYQDWMTTNDRLSASMDVLTNAVDALTDEMQDQDAAAAAETKEQATAALKQAETTARNKLLNNAGLYDGGHSLKSDFNEDGWAKLAVTAANNALADMTGNEAYRKRGNHLEDFLSLSAEEMNLLNTTEAGRNALSEVLYRIQHNSDDGNYGAQGDLAGEVQEFMNKYGASAYEAIEDKFYETVNGLSFDQFKENFLSAMMDLESGVDDFADTFNESLTKSLMNDTLKSEYNDRMEALYNGWGELMTNKGTLSEAEYKARVQELQEEQAQLSKDLINERNEIAAATGYDENASQKATAASIQNITQDQADQLVGRITAVQIAVEAIGAQHGVMTGQLSDITLLQAQGNSYLSEIAKTQKAIYGELEGRIEKIQKRLEAVI